MFPSLIFLLIINLFILFLLLKRAPNILSTMLIVKKYNFKDRDIVKGIISLIRGNRMVDGNHKREKDQRIMGSNVAIVTK